MLRQKQLLRQSDLELTSSLIRTLDNNLWSPGSLGQLCAQIVRHDLAKDLGNLL